VCIIFFCTTLLPIFSNSTKQPENSAAERLFPSGAGQRDDHVAAIRLALLPLETVGIGGRPAGRRTGRACAPARIARWAPGHLCPCEQDGRQPTNRPASSTPLTMLSPLVAATNTTGSIWSSNSKNIRKKKVTPKTVH
jgi:hypothetical protein